MAWSTHRKATDSDMTALNAMAERFAERHNLGGLYADQDGTYSYQTMDLQLYPGYGNDSDADKYLYRLWLACVRRALDDKHCEGVAYGYVGRHAA